MMEVPDSLYILRPYSTTQDEWNIAIIILQNLPIKLLTTSTHRFTLGIEKEVINSAYVFLIFLDIPGCGNADSLDNFQQAILLMKQFTEFAALISMQLHGI